MKIFLLVNGETQGPYSQEEVLSRLKQGGLPPDTKFSVGESRTWCPMSEFQPPGRKWPKVVLAVVLLILAGAGAVGFRWFQDHFRTPKSTEPEPPNVSYKKWEKTSSLSVKIEPTQWERRLGRNLHRAAYQAATNLVSQTLAKPESARFEPYAKAKITGVDWRFLAKVDYTATNKSGEFHVYDFRAFLKRDTNEVWTLEYLDKDKEDVPSDKKPKSKSSE